MGVEPELVIKMEMALNHAKGDILKRMARIMRVGRSRRLIRTIIWEQVGENDVLLFICGFDISSRAH